MIKGPDKKQRVIASRLGLAGLMVALVGGCVSLESEEGRLPAAVRSAINTFSAKGYPDLTKIPPAPTSSPTSASWSALESGLVTQGNALMTNPEARLPLADEANRNWAEAARRTLTEDPRAEPVPPVPIEGAVEADWAAKARTKLDADIARLPPP
jgi:hypothetical protein